MEFHAAADVCPTKKGHGMALNTDSADFTLTGCSKNSKFAGRSKMVRCKEAKKNRARSHLADARSGFFR
jgi:hypothetical protein